MQINIAQLGKKYRREWIVRRVDLTLSAGTSYTFVGPNGSGKSTLLQLLAGNLPATEGTISYSLNGRTLDPDTWFRQISVATPYLELVEELTLDELLVFHQTFKPFKAGLTPATIADRLWLAGARHKEIKYFSSGMKQRVKLGLAFSPTYRLLSSMSQRRTSTGRVPTGITSRYVSSAPSSSYLLAPISRTSTISASTYST